MSASSPAPPNYRIDHNTLCGNNSAEYGGAISHFGLSSGGKIDHNRIWFNRSYDEGGAVFVGSELPANPNTMPVGAGAVDITENTLQANLANDDGGAIRLLMVDGRRRSQTGEGAQGTIRLYDDRVNILNNTIANNVSTHEGGGIALDDSTNVVVANNTVAHNITTATAMTSTGEPAPAGLSTAGNSFLLQAELDKRYGANTRPLFSKPTLFNNVVHRQPLGLVVAHAGPPRHRPGRRRKPGQPLGHRPRRQPLQRVGQRPPLPLAAQQPVRRHGEQHAQPDREPDEPDRLEL